ncbi:MAG: cyclic nucleotide-binding domain-containing protein [Pseudomonadota bacterium]
MREVRFEADERIFSEGDPSDQCYRILSGEVEIRVRQPSAMSARKEGAVTTLGPGEVFGEMSVIDGGSRSASAVAKTVVICAAYTAEEIDAQLGDDPTAALDVIRTLIRRLRDANRQLAKRR